MNYTYRPFNVDHPSIWLHRDRLPGGVLRCSKGAKNLILKRKESNSKTPLPKNLWLKLYPNEVF